MLYQSSYDSPLGQLILISKENKLVGLYFSNSKYLPDDLNQIAIADDQEVFKITKECLLAYFTKRAKDFEKIPLELHGTNFQKKVWAELQKIPYGTTSTYGEIAQKMAIANHQKKMSAQAVGQAISKNPLSIIIPCHRVIGHNGQLTGYSGGLSNKIALLNLEGVNPNP